MYILLESVCDKITESMISDIDCMGAVKTETDAMNWRNLSPDFREYKYIADAKIENAT